MNEIKKIDMVLSYFLSIESPPKRTFTELQKEIIKNGVEATISTKELIEIVSKLEKDGYIIKELHENISHYFSSFEGRMFFNKGGYKFHYSSEKTMQRNKKFMTWLTIINIIAIISLTFLNYKATTKSIENKDEVSTLKQMIINLSLTNDSLLNAIIKRNPK